MQAIAIFCGSSSGNDAHYVESAQFVAEQWTWAQLGIHQKPCAFLNVLGYYDPLITMVNQMANKHFTKQMYADMLIHSDSIETIISEFQNYQAPHAKWTKGAVEP